MMENQQQGQAWKCPACGEEVDGGFDICWQCGSRADGSLDPDFEPEVGLVPQERRLCHACGYPLKGLLYETCPECGAPFEKQQRDTIPPPEPNPDDPSYQKWSKASKAIVIGLCAPPPVMVLVWVIPPAQGVATQEGIVLVLFVAWFAWVLVSPIVWVMISVPPK